MRMTAGLSKQRDEVHAVTFTRAMRLRFSRSHRQRGSRLGFSFSSDFKMACFDASSHVARWRVTVGRERTFHASLGRFMPPASSRERDDAFLLMKR